MLNSTKALSPPANHHAQPHVPQQQCFTIGAAEINVQLPVWCCDVALTKDGQSLLLAAQEHGLLEFSSTRGQELSRWRPPKISSSISRVSSISSRDGSDQVLAVAASRDERVAVSLRYAQVVVLLIRCETGGNSNDTAAAAGDGWIEHLRFDPLPWSAWQLSAHGDVLAASVGSAGAAVPAELLLLSLSRGRRLSEAVLQREYVIGNLAVAAGVIITGSRDKVEPGGQMSKTKNRNAQKLQEGRQGDPEGQAAKRQAYVQGQIKLGGRRRAAHLLDAHRLADDGNDERLWRLMLSGSDEKEWRGVICADSSGGCLYAAVCRSDESNARVRAMSLMDGSKLRDIAFTFDSAARPWRLSLSDRETAAAEQKLQTSDGSDNCDSGPAVLLAALNVYGRMVSVHRCIREMLQ